MYDVVGIHEQYKKGRLADSERRDIWCGAGSRRTHASIAQRIQPRSSSSAPHTMPASTQEPVEGSQEFMMHVFKVLPCPKGYRHNWKRCPYAHEGESERRRDPRAFNYSAIVCPATKKGVECPSGDDCPWAHNVFEYWLHPQRFRTELCSKKDLCKRRFCFFAHSKSELRESKVEMEQGFGNTSCAAPQPQASMAAVAPRDYHTRNIGCYGLPPNADVLSMQGRQEGMGVPQVDINPNGIWSNAVQGSFLKHEIHDSLGSLPENIGWSGLHQPPSTGKELQGNYINPSTGSIPHLYLGPRGGIDRLSVSQDARENLIPSLGPSRVSPRQDFQKLLAPLQPSRMSPRQQLEENFQLPMTAMRFSPRQNAHIPLPPAALDRFSPRPGPPGTVEQIGAPFALSDALSSMDSIQDILLASGMSHATWPFNPLDSVDERMTGHTSFGSSINTQTLRFMESLDINNSQTGPVEQQGNSLLGATNDKLLCDHLNFFTDP